MTHTYFSRPGLWIAGLLLTLMLGCSKSSTTTPVPTPTPTVTDCLIQKLAFDKGQYTLYTFDANGFLTGVASYFLDANGKIPTSVAPDKLTYNAQGLLDRVTRSADSQYGNGYEQYTWANGALTKVESFVSGKLFYQIDVTTDANKRITALKNTNVGKDPNYADDITTKYTLDAQGRYTRTEVSFGTDGIIYTEDYTAFESVIKSPWTTLKGVPFFVDGYIDQYAQSQPVSPYAATKEVDYYAYDDTGKFVGLKKVYDATYTRTANANNYPVTRKDVETVSGTTSTNTYQYSNCN
jgi:hypothetical protein